MMRVATLLVMLVVSTAHADTRLDDREVVIAGFGGVWMQADGVTQSGMAIQATFDKTYDRFEAQLDYTLADLRDDSKMQPGGTLHRLGASARYQAARKRVDELTLDLVLEGGLGVQYFERDDATAIGRTDLMIGLGLRMLSNADRDPTRRMFIGMEAMLRTFVTPSGDKGFIATFGVPFGK